MHTGRKQLNSRFLLLLVSAIYDRIHLLLQIRKSQCKAQMKFKIIFAWTLSRRCHIRINGEYLLSVRFRFSVWHGIEVVVEYERKSLTIGRREGLSCVGFWFIWGWLKKLYKGTASNSVNDWWFLKRNDL